MSNSTFGVRTSLIEWVQKCEEAVGIYSNTTHHSISQRTVVSGLTLEPLTSSQKSEAGTRRYNRQNIPVYIPNVQVYSVMIPVYFADYTVVCQPCKREQAEPKPKLKRSWTLRTLIERANSADTAGISLSFTKLASCSLLQHRCSFFPLSLGKVLAEGML
jgi:hypothetical protein